MGKPEATSTRIGVFELRLLDWIGTQMGSSSRRDTLDHLLRWVTGSPEVMVRFHDDLVRSRMKTPPPKPNGVYKDPRDVGVGVYVDPEIQKRHAELEAMVDNVFENQS